MDTEEGCTMDIELFGRKYTVNTQKEERRTLLEAVQYLDKRMRDVAKMTGAATAERLAVMTALNITHELITLRSPGNSSISNIQNLLAQMNEDMDAVLL